MVLLVTLWFVSLPFSFADLWWQHHWGLGPFDVAAWLGAQWSTLGAGGGLRDGDDRAARGPGAALPPLVAHRVAGDRRRSRCSSRSCRAGSSAAGAKPLASPLLRSDVVRLERVEHVSGTPVRVQDVSSWTSQANAFTVGFGPATHVVVWNTLLDGRFSRGEDRRRDRPRARSRAQPSRPEGARLDGAARAADAVARRARHRAGAAASAIRPTCRCVILTLTVLALLTAPIQNVVSRRYEAEADWRALNATRDPASAAKALRELRADEPRGAEPAALGLPWLENHPTLMQRIAMAERWQALSERYGGRRSRAGPGCP